MSEKQGFKLKKNQIIGVSVAALLLIGGGSVYAVNSQKKTQAEKIELAEKKEKEDYKKLSLQVDDSVKKAYDTRSAKDIELAENIIKKLKEQDQKGPQEKITKLHSFLGLIKKTDQLIATAEKSKKDADIKAAQKSIDSEKDAYLAKDKKAQQTRLDKLKKSIEEQKKKDADKKKADEEKAKNEATAKQADASMKTNEVKSEQNTNKATTGEQATDKPGSNVGAENITAGEQAPAAQPEAPGYVEEQPDYGNGGGQGGGTVNPTPTPSPAPAPTPTPSSAPNPNPTPTPDPEPTPNPGLPAGWIVPPYPIDSDNLWNWIFDNGYSGYDVSDGYIKPY
ncbi:hypothetical protein [Enterococcus faecalis]|uniref:hypothetical protein n=1 Tax=Enterococcus faecalis TaxID=1351 RepID=UPI001C8BFCC5|nr:hypothetical protein [Enterococcus faecalis]